MHCWVGLLYLLDTYAAVVWYTCVLQGEWKDSYTDCGLSSGSYSQASLTG